MARPRTFDQAAVVDATVDQFWTTGYTATSTDDLCECSQLSRSSLYNCFGSKRDVYLAALGRYIEQRVEEREQTLTNAGTGREVLRAALGGILDVQYADPTRRVCFALHAVVEVGTTDEQVGTILADNAAAFDKTFEALIAKGVADRSISSAVDPAALARVVHAALDGMQVRARICPDRNDLESDIDTLMRLIP